jgi:hypothetical protein
MSDSDEDDDSDQVKIPHWFRPELRRVSKLHHKGLLDSTQFTTTKEKILGECHEAMLRPHIAQYNSRSVSPKKMKKYIDRLHSSPIKRLQYGREDASFSNAASKPSSPSTPNTMEYKPVWKPTGAFVVRAQPEMAATTSATTTTVLGNSKSGGSMFSTPTKHNNNNNNTIPTSLPQQPKQSTVASAFRINQLSQPRGTHPWFSAPAKLLSKCEYLPMQPRRIPYQYMKHPNTNVTASPWPFLREQQELDGLSVTSTTASTHKIVHPILLHKAQKNYTERIEHHLDRTDLEKVFQGNMKLPPLDIRAHSDFVRY